MRLYHRDQTPFLYPLRGGDGAGGGGGGAWSAKLAAQGNLSAVGREVEAADALERWPLLAKARYTETVLQPGDALYIPNGVWHYVRSLSTSVSVNYWF